MCVYTVALYAFIESSLSVNEFEIFVRFLRIVCLFFAAREFEGSGGACLVSNASFFFTTTAINELSQNPDVVRKNESRVSAGAIVFGSYIQRNTVIIPVSENTTDIETTRLVVRIIYCIFSNVINR